MLSHFKNEEGSYIIILRALTSSGADQLHANQVKWNWQVPQTNRLSLGVFDMTCSHSVKKMELSEITKKSWNHKTHVIPGTKFSSNTNPKWPVIVRLFLNSSDIVWMGPTFCHANLIFLAIHWKMHAFFFYVVALLFNFVMLFRVL